MPNGTLKLYNKQTNALLVSLDILGTFNIEDNLNETPSNMKVKVITTNTYREEFEVNTVAYHEDTNTWWVIKSDESSYMMTGEYEHEIQLVEYLEFYAYRHLPNCAFAPNTYDLEDMLNRLFDIAKLSITVTYPSFLDKDKIMPFMSFENYTVANAIKHIARAINAIPKMSVSLSPSYQPQLTFINRNGLDTAIVETLNTQFPIAYEKNLNSTDQFLTRSVSNITNAKATLPIRAPEFGGFYNVVPNNLSYDSSTWDNARVILPSKIDNILELNIYPPILLEYNPGGGGAISNLFSGYYFDKQTLEDIINASSLFTSGEKATIISLLPNPYSFSRVGFNDPIDISYDPLTSDNGRANLFKNKMTLNSKFGFDTTDSTTFPNTKDRTAYWLPFTNELVMPLSFRNNLNGLLDHNPEYLLYNVGGVTLKLKTKYVSSVVPNNEILIQVYYFPVADIKVTIDNDNDSQDEKFFNQSGKIIDAMSVTKLITSHTNDSVDGTKIRNARYTSFSSVLSIGQIVKDNNQLYVITQRSIDAQVKDNNEYYNVIYTLSRNRVARSENITADSSVISYKTPDDNLVFRNQLYKDYIELSLVDEHTETPYLPLLQMFRFALGTIPYIGTKFDFTMVAKNEYGNTPTTVRYLKTPTVFDLHKSKLVNVNWQDNNILGYDLVQTGSSYAQTPIVYTDSKGFATNFEFMLVNQAGMKSANNWYNLTYATNAVIPFDKPNVVPSLFYKESLLDKDYYSILIQENASGGKPYKKDAYEIPVLTYMLQGNDSYSTQGNMVFGENFFRTFPLSPTSQTIGGFRIQYVVDSSIRFTNENAVRIFKATLPNSTTRIAEVTRSNSFPRNVFIELYPTFGGSKNTTSFTNIAFIATDGVDYQFLFAINDYNAVNPNTFGDIKLFINNWKI